MSNLALQSNGIWKADLGSKVVAAIYYESRSRLLAVELQHGGMRLFSEAAEGAVFELVRHHAPGLYFKVTPTEAFGRPLSRFRPKGALFLRRIRRTNNTDQLQRATVDN